MIGSGAEVVDKMFVDNNFLFAFGKRQFVCDSCMYMVGMYVCMRTKMPGTKYVETKEDENGMRRMMMTRYVYLLLANKFTNTNTK